MIKDTLYPLFVSQDTPEEGGEEETPATDAPEEGGTEEG
jgi:hypothetical protein